MDYNTKCNGDNEHHLNDNYFTGNFVDNDNDYNNNYSNGNIVDNNDKKMKIKTKSCIITTKNFIEKSKKKFGDNLFDYSFVKLIDSKISIILICKKFGHVFAVRPSTHLHKEDQGCPHCFAQIFTMNSEKNNLLKYHKVPEKNYDFSKITFQ